MKRTFFLFFFLFLALATIVSADNPSNYPVCKDTKGPNGVTGLSASGNVVVSWNAAIDTDADGHTDPTCNYVDHYLIYRDAVFLGPTGGLSYTDSVLADGTYMYKVVGVDGANNVGDATTLSYTVGGSLVSGGSGGGGGGGGGGGSSRRNSDTSDDSTEEPRRNPRRTTNGSTNETVTLEATDVVPAAEENGGALGRITGFFVGEGNTGNVLVALGLLVLVITGYFGVRNWFDSDSDTTIVVPPTTTDPTSIETSVTDEKPTAGLSDDEDDFEIIYPSDTKKP